ncbi:MAG TPA: hypothetical protein VHD62_18935 [Opitutaceae bacterium]|nr:hypothetical protein [Opitutaceae bacterium]
MRRSSLVIILAALLVGGSAIVYEVQSIARERAALTAEQKRVARLEHQLAELRQQRDDALRELELATQSLASASANAQPPRIAGDPARVTALNSWLVRLKRLKETFDQHPDQRIPELAFLTDLDWLTLARQLQLDSEEDLRRARAKAREAAFNKFRVSLAQAMRNYGAVANGAPLSDLFQLVPYFRPPLDPAVLARYEIADLSNPGAPSNRRVITERTPVDGEFDLRHTVNLDGRGGGSSPWIVDSLRQSTLTALSEYAAANNGQRPKNQVDILPYIHDPTTKIIQEAVLTYANDHHGQESGDPTALRPYVKDPAARALLEKLIAAKQNDDAP